MEANSKMEANKSDIEQVEDSDAPRSHSIDATKGDRALALIGDERVSLTDEDVSSLLTRCLLWCCR